MNLTRAGALNRRRNSSQPIRQVTLLWLTQVVHKNNDTFYSDGQIDIDSIDVFMKYCVHQLQCTKEYVVPSFVLCVFVLWRSGMCFNTPMAPIKWMTQWFHFSVTYPFQTSLYNKWCVILITDVTCILWLWDRMCNTQLYCNKIYDMFI